MHELLKPELDIISWELVNRKRNIVIKLEPIKKKTILPSAENETLLQQFESDRRASQKPLDRKKENQRKNFFKKK